MEVVVDDGKTVLATLKAGSYFGEISILNMGTAGKQKILSDIYISVSLIFFRTNSPAYLTHPLWINGRRVICRFPDEAFLHFMPIFCHF